MAQPQVFPSSRPNIFCDGNPTWTSSGSQDVGSGLTSAVGPHSRWMLLSRQTKQWEHARPSCYLPGPCRTLSPPWTLRWHFPQHSFISLSLFLSLSQFLSLSPATFVTNVLSPTSTRAHFLSCSLCLNVIEFLVLPRSSCPRVPL